MRKARKFSAMILSMVMMLSLLPGVSPTASAATTDGLTITGDTEYIHTDYTYADGLLHINGTGNYTIANTDPTTATTDRIAVSGAATVTLAGVNISTSVSAPFSTGADGVKIILKDGTTNTLTSGNFRHAGLQNDENSIEIACEHSDEDNHECTGSCGTLNAAGGYQASGIGGGSGSNGSNITINGGNIIASSTYQEGTVNGAGIGGGSDGNGSNIIINGGNITATGNRNGAAIGGGGWGHGTNITINGGTVKATGSSFGAGIGGGIYGYGSNITINDGNVTATSDYNGAGIGGGERANGTNITISGGTVYAEGSDRGDLYGVLAAGVGNGIDGAASNIKISPLAGKLIYAYNGEAYNRTPLNGSPFTSETDVTNLLSGKAFYSYTDTFVQITNAAELVAFAERVNSGDVGVSGLLAKDIDLSGVNFTPIGNETNKFSGIFDGNGHKITNFGMEIAEKGDYGLFGCVDGGTVRDFHISGAVSADISEVGGALNYGVIGRALNDAKIKDISSTVNFTLTKTDEANAAADDDRIAGIVGQISNGNVEIDRCTFGGTLDLGTSRFNNAGGITAYIVYNSHTQLSDCAFTGTIIANYENQRPVGGILGYHNGQNIKIQHCLSIGTITATEHTHNGLLVGCLKNHTQPEANIYCNFVADNYGAYGEFYFDDTSIDIVPDNTYTTVTAEQLASGTIAYLLQGDRDVHIWGQTIRTDPYPIIGGARVYLDYTGAYTNVPIVKFGITAVTDANGKPTATAAIPTAGEYTVVFADYENGRLNSVDLVTQAFSVGMITVSPESDIIFGYGDKIMLCDNMISLVPLCEAYIMTTNYEYEYVTCTGGLDGETGSNLIDGDVTTKWCSDLTDNAAEPYIIFKYNYPVIMKSYTLTTADNTADEQGQNWTAWTLYGSSSENGEWTEIHKVTDASLPTTNLTRSEPFIIENNSTRYLYYKLVMNSNADGESQQMAEFIPVVQMPSADTPDETPSDTVGAFTITGGTLGTDYIHTGDALTITGTGNYTIKNTYPTTATSDRIEISAAATVTLAGVNISTWSGAPISTTADGVKIILTDGSTNTLASGNMYYAGLQNGENSIEITCEHSDEDNHECTVSCGTLNATGGNCSSGIGGAGWSNGSNITVSGGNVNATGGYGAGIGGGQDSNGSNITVSGGTVNAASSYCGAGIGGGFQGTGSNITIKGGTIKAVANEGAGVGSGFNGGAASNIKIIPLADTQIFAYNASDNTGTALNGSPFISETDITNLLSGKTFYSETAKTET